MQNNLKSRKLLLYFIISGVIKAEAATRSLQKLERNAAFDDCTCLSQDLLFSTGVWSLSRCALMCTENDACQTMFYNKNEGKCHGCTVHYTSGSLPLSSQGFMHFHKEQKVCEDGYTAFQGSCYSLTPFLTFENGVSYCEADDAHPVFIETSEENEFIKTFLPTDQASVWYIGITDSVENGEFKYYGTSQAVQYLDFDIDQPDDGGTNSQQCVIIVGSHVNFKWHDFACTGVMPTICEKML